MTPRIADVTGHYIYLTIDGIEYRVYYEEAGTGTPVLMQHTAGTDGRQWRHLLEDADLTADYRLVAYDLPYHGRSLPPVGKEWWKEEYALHQDFLMKFVVALARALDMEHGIFMGCSMGGHLAPDLALHYPGFFRAVLAVEGGLATHDAEPFNPYLYHPRCSNEMKGALMITQTSPRSPEALRRETGWVYTQGAPSVFKGDVVYYLQEHDLTDTAKDIDTSRTAVHVLSGDYDWSATPERCLALAEAIPGATYTRMEGMGHFPMSEDPVGFKKYLVPLLHQIVSM
jgi:pimeloyl-ACP methyl ester carboxylesterase